jgi:predicted RNA-binding Zn-ribbon protein involved in translation (DUF1610 family)
MTNLKSVTQHNAEARERHAQREREAREGVRTGLACEKCGGEMIDRTPWITNMGNPASRWIHCEKCGNQDLMVLG